MLGKQDLILSTITLTLTNNSNIIIHLIQVIMLDLSCLMPVYLQFSSNFLSLLY